MSPDNASATAINPSALGTLDEGSLTYSHVSALEGSAFPDRLDAAWFGTQVTEGFGFGIGPEFMRSRTPGLSSTNGFSTGVSFGGPVWSLGTSYRFRSPRNDAPNVHTADVALSFRPATTLAISVIGRDLAGERPYLGSLSLRRSGVLAMALRPLGDDRFTVEFDGLVDDAGDMGLRTAALAYVPYVGRIGLAGERGEANDREFWTLTAGLDVRWGGLSVGGAAHTTDDFDGAGWSLMVDVHGMPRPGIPGQRYVAKIKMESLGPRALINTIAAMEQALYDPRIQGVVFEPRDTGAGLATAQEVRLMIQALERAGKPVYCHLESASGSEFYLCAGAKRITIDPAGLIRLMGVSGDALYFGDLLRDVGVRADFVRIGRYKSAPEQYTNGESSEAAREQRSTLLDDAYRRLVADLSADLDKDEASIKSLIDRGPFIPREALDAKLVAEEIDRRDLDDQAKEVFGPHTPVSEQQLRERHARFGPTGQIGVVVIDGTIVDGDNVDVPFLDVHMSGGRTVSEAIDKLADDPRIRAIVLRVDSPGGAVMASDQIWRAVKRAREKKPVIASMGDVAASGGYYVASAANEIWALPSTITGSIGIFYGKVDVAPLAERFHVGIETEKRGAHAGADSLFRPFTDEERAALVDKLRAWYRQFLLRVSEGRNMTVEQVDAVARGHVYSGDRAKELKLVDSLGGFGSALMRARELGKLGPDAKIVVLPRRPSSLLDYVTGAQARAQANTAPVPDALKPFLGQLYLFSRMSGAQPMALYEGPVTLR